MNTFVLYIVHFFSQIKSLNSLLNFCYDSQTLGGYLIMVEYNTFENKCG